MVVDGFAGYLICSQSFESKEPARRPHPRDGESECDSLGSLRCMHSPLARATFFHLAHNSDVRVQPEDTRR
jgi:hypothetical protein